ncbi:MAG: hypothetical protein WC135_01940 [Bacteroidales bacterium]
MIEDNKSKNYNSIIVSLVSELLYDKNNSEIDKKDCYSHIAHNLKINLEKDIFSKIIDSSPNFIQTPNVNDIGIKLTDNKYTEIDENVNKHCISKYISDFLYKSSLSEDLKPAIESLLYQAIYENINSFTVQNIDSLIPDNAKNNYSIEEIKAFNDFLSVPDREKNTALFNTFLKAVEFAIITSGKGVSEFTKEVFKGKEYILDANIIFRLLGIGGKERQESLVNLIEQCNHQGIRFFYTNESYQEFKRKVEASILDIERATENKSITLIEEMLKEDRVEFNQGFITHYAQCKSEKIVRSPDQYELMIMTNFRSLCTKYNINTLSLNGNLRPNEITLLQDELFDKKKLKNEYSNYTKTAAMVDAINVLFVKFIRGQNDYNYSDIKSFYLSTDRTLNRILAEKAEDKIVETILPSQLFILHNSLSEDDDNKDYEEFTKFLKRRTTEFKFSGEQVLTYIDEIRNYTTEPENIKDVLKAYSDKKYNTSLLDVDVEPEYVSIKEFTKTYFDMKLEIAEIGDKKYKKAIDSAINDFPEILKSVKMNMRIIDVILSILLIPITILIMKIMTNNIYIIVLSTILVEIVKFILSSRLSLYSNWTRKIFINKVEQSNYQKTFQSIDKVYMNKANEYVENEINIWK